jgi:hypothetical protein
VIWEDEEWADVVGLPRYSVSSFGRVFDFKRERCLIQTPDRVGYLRVKLWFGDIRKTVSVHRLVAFAFLEFKSEDFEVNHIDGDKTYNYISNLEFVTRSEQMRHAYENELIDVPGRTPIVCIELNTEYKSIREAARILNIHDHKCITRVLDNPNKSTHGFHFKTKGVMP